MGLFDVLTGQQNRRGMSPLMMVLLGALAYRQLKGKGGLGGLLGGMGGLGGRGGLGGLGGLLGGGASAGMLSSGLQELLERFRANGQGEKAESWVATGPNRPIAPHEVEEALGEERIQWLMKQTGMARDELVVGLSGELPEVVDKLTPEGRIPTEEEAQQVVKARLQR